MRRTGTLRRIFLPLIALVLLFACASAGHAMSAEAVWPEASGKKVDKDGKLVVDLSHKDQGYVMVRVSKKSSKKYKLRVTHDDTKLMYDISANEKYMVCPLQLGNGKYTLELFENVKSNKYSSEGKVKVKAELGDKYAAFLFPNPYVDYDLMTAAVK